MSAAAPFKPPMPERIALPGPVGVLESVLEVPLGHDGRVALICHPHPLFGGTLQNKVVHTTARALQERGIATLRFNFRGVGASAGTFDDGRGETDDALAAADWLTARYPASPLILAGFSFGAYVAYRVATESPVQRLYTIAPPIRRFDFGSQRVPTMPWLVIQGDQDELVEYSSVVTWMASVVPKPHLATIAGAEHFFHGRLNELKIVVQEFLDT
ncbi:MAG: alpha/beta fold hydrolase [Pseudomonadota bacterium]|jgi:alpha/beta superfamily hydrolase